MLSDIRLAFRQLFRYRAHSAICLLTLALCIGANTAMFSIVRAVLLRPLPFVHPERIVTVQETNLEKGIESSNVSTTTYLAWREQAQSFAPLSAADYLPATISGQGEGHAAERVTGWRVSATMFQVYGVQPIRGRLFTKANEVAGGDQVLVIRESLWKRMFNSDPEIVGRSVLVNSQPHTIIGVLPDSFDLLDRERFEIWKPLVLDPNAADAATDSHLVVRGVLAPSATMESARAEMSGISRRLAAARPAAERGWGARVISLSEDIVGSYQMGLWTLTAALCAVLLIGCVNLANLILTRAVSRQREIAIRIAVGASRLAIVRQLLAESVILAFAGAGLGLLVALYVMPILRAVIPTSLPRVADAGIDFSALLFTGLVAVVAGIVVGILPAWYATHVDALNGLKQGASRTQSGDRKTGRWRQALLVSEVALSFALLVIAALLLKSFANLRSVDPGFKTENVLNNVIVLPPARYGDADSANNFARGVVAAHPKAAAFYERAYNEVRQIPGVVTVGSITGLPLYGNSQFSTYRRTNEPATSEHPAVQDTIGGDYFPTMSIPLISGRFFSRFDGATARRVAIINEALAQRDFAGSNPVGESIYLEGGQIPYEIVGVVGNSRQFNLDRESTPEVFTHVAQTATTYAYFLVQVSKLDQRITAEIRKVFATIDPDLPLPQRTLQSALDQALGTPRFQADLLGAFAAVALLLALIGVYGVISYGVAQRRPELAIRSALGATSAHIRQLVFNQGMKLVVLGLMVGSGMAVATSIILRHQLFAMSPLEPRSYGLVTGIFLLTTAIACLIPARRASTVNPATVLRAD